MRLVLVQFGNYAEAVHRFAAGGKETFYGQRYSVDVVAKLAAQVDDLTVVHLSKDDPEERLPSGVRSLGLSLYPANGRPRHLALLRTLQRLRPDHLVLFTPQPAVLLWALATRVRVLPVFADSFRAPGLKSKVTAALLARLLNNERVEWVSNHNLAASLDLVRIGVKRDKVLPFDWPAFMTPAERPPKTLRPTSDRHVIYVGQVNEEKGVGDLIRAFKRLNTEGDTAWSLTIVGLHDGSFTPLVNELGLGARVTFAGRIPHEQIVPRMSEHDAVVVASRHDCAEGLPMTIYEALCSRAPVVVSDHPMFRFKIQHESNGLVFRAGDPTSLADSLRRLCGDPDLYARLSVAGEQAGADFFCPLKFGDLLNRWLTGTDETRRDLATYSLASGRYTQTSAAPPAAG